MYVHESIAPRAHACNQQNLVENFFPSWGGKLIGKLIFLSLIYPLRVRDFFPFFFSDAANAGKGSLLGKNIMDLRHHLKT